MAAPSFHTRWSRIAAVALGALIVAGCTSVSRSSRPNTRIAYTISGTLSSAAAVAGDTVALSGDATATTTAGSGGQYAFPGLAAGAYVVTPARAGFTFGPLSRAVSVTSGDATGIDFTATANAAPTWALSGTVGGAGGSGALLTLSGAASATTFANGSGHYAFGSLADGSYTVTPSHVGYTFAPVHRDTAVSGADVASVDFTGTAVIVPTWTLSGTLTGAGGAGAQVALSGHVSSATTANGSGQYSFSGLTDGSYTVTPTHLGYTFSPAHRDTSVSGASVTGVDFSAAAVVPTWTLSGTLGGAGGSGAQVALSGHSNGSTTANGSGQYSFTGLTSGSYTVTPAHTGYTFAPLHRDTTVVSANVSSVNFTGTANAPVTLFDDEFDAGALDTAWVAMNRHGDYSNSEVQCYSPANVSVTGGLLDIVSLAQSATCGDALHAATGWNVTSGMVQWRTRRFTYGTIEVRAKMAGGQGTWPSVWLLGANCETSNVGSADNTGTCVWPEPGSDEIDMIEIKNGALTTVWENLITSGPTFQSFQATASDVSQDFHVYKMTWSAGRIEWWIDGVSNHVVTSHVPSRPMFVMINTALGGQGGTVNTATLPQHTQLDYIRITQP